MTSKKWIRIGAIVLIALLSATLIYNFSISATFNGSTIASLDAKKDTVMKLSMAAAGVALILSLLPGDAASPISNALTNLTGYFLLITAALFFEKYFVTLTGLVTFRILIPVACLLLAVYEFKPNLLLKRIAQKMILFGFAIFLLIPVSMKAADLFQNTFDYNETIETAIDSKDNMEEVPSAETSDTNLWQSISQGVSGIISGDTNIVDIVKENSIDKVVKQGEERLNLFIESIAVLLVTTCLIPILILLLFSWLLKLFFNVNLNVPRSLPKLSEEIHKKKPDSEHETEL